MLLSLHLSYLTYCGRLPSEIKSILRYKLNITLGNNGSVKRKMKGDTKHTQFFKAIPTPLHGQIMFMP